MTESTAPNSSPRHVALIMDGNRRWAKKNKLPAIAGHKKGAEVVRAVLKHAANIGIEYLTLYAFSTENWKRSPEEVSGVMNLLVRYLINETKSLHKNNVRVRAFGDLKQFSAKIQKLVNEVMELTKDNTGINLCVALGYGSTSEVVHATKIIAQKVKDGTLEIDQIDEDTVHEHLWTQGIPDPDLLIRTGGEQRLSNYLLLQLAYAEFIFQDVFWPDFSENYFDLAIQEYGERERRFGT
jgi:undecaprenyl diphosphate synthase